VSPDHATAVLLALAAGGGSAALVAGPPPVRRPARVPRRARASTGPTRAPDLAADPRAALVVAGVVLVAAGPVAALLAWGAIRSVGALRDRQRAARRRAAVIDELPDVVDLVRLGVGAGLTLPQVVPLVAGDARSPIAGALLAAHHAGAAGRPFADALGRHLGDLGDAAAGLAHVLTDHLRYGTPFDPELRRLGHEVRAARRHRAERAARRVPVRLLLPLVTCVLPAFALLTVVPLLAGSLQGAFG
jgi:tight adherence protein C